MAIALPAFSDYIRNVKVRTEAEALFPGSNWREQRRCEEMFLFSSFLIRCRSRLTLHLRRNRRAGRGGLCAPEYPGFH